MKVPRLKVSRDVAFAAPSTMRAARPRNLSASAIDLEWFVMTPVLLRQFRLFYAQNKPVGVVLWAKVNEDVEARLAAGTTKLRPQDWSCGERLWVVEVISPFGAPEEMIANFKAHVFPDREVRYVAVSREGKKEVNVV